MARKFRELREKMSPESRARVSARVAQTLREMPLAELRQAHSLTQTRLAEIMEVEQSEISRIEKRTDVYISTLRSYIEAMGGSLRIEATFPEGSVEITQFHEQESTDRASA
jgi:transcriptional regulator with XRE-family HTH domain